MYQIQGVPGTGCTRYRVVDHKYNYRVYQLQIYDMRYQIQIQGVLETDTRCTRYGVYQVHGVPGTGCTRYRVVDHKYSYRVYQLQIYDMRYQIQIQGVLETDTRCTSHRVYQIHGC